jgi:hypothetical protein
MIRLTEKETSVFMMVGLAAWASIIAAMGAAGC